MNTLKLSANIPFATLQRIVLLGTDRSIANLPPDTLPSGANRDKNTDAATWTLHWLAQSRLISQAAGQGVHTVPTNTLTIPCNSLNIYPSKQMNAAATHALNDCLSLGKSAKDLTLDLLNMAQAHRFECTSETLPKLLDFISCYHKDCLQPLRYPAVLGVRGHWLAAQNPTWASITTTSEKLSTSVKKLDKHDVLAQWAIATTSERLRMLPAHAELARELIESTRADDNSTEVAQYISACTHIFSMADQDWLENLLDAKHKPVRNAAIDVLRHLPESKLSQRALLYLTGELFTLRVEQKRSVLGLIKGKPSLHIDLPDLEAMPVDTYKALEKKLARDGYTLKAEYWQNFDNKTINIGIKESLLRQCLENITLSTLAITLNLSLDITYQLWEQYESHTIWISTIARASIRHHVNQPIPPNLREILLNSHLLKPELKLQLIADLPTQTRQDYFYNSPDLKDTTLLIQCFTPQEGMGKNLSNWVLLALKKYIETLNPYHYQWSEQQESQLVVRLDISVLHDFVMQIKSEQASTLADKTLYTDSFTQRILQKLELRLAYSQALAD